MKLQKNTSLNTLIAAFQLTVDMTTFDALDDFINPAKMNEFLHDNHLIAENQQFVIVDENSHKYNDKNSNFIFDFTKLNVLSAISKLYTNKKTNVPFTVTQYAIITDNVDLNTVDPTTLVALYSLSENADTLNEYIEMNYLFDNEGYEMTPEKFIEIANDNINQ